MDAKWFVSLLDRLKDLSEMYMGDVAANPVLRDRLRMHPVEWGNRHVTIRLSELTWLERKYLNNDEYEFIQFHVGRALGRVMGFFDENQIFNIVLLDPQHNIHLSAYNDHELRPCSTMDSEYTELMAKVHAIHSGLQCVENGCRAKLAAAQTCVSPYSRVILIPLRDEDLALLKDAVDDGRVTSVSEIFINGLMTAMA